MILDGKNLADKLLLDLKNKISLLNKNPQLIIIIIGNNSESEIYVNIKKRKAIYVGIACDIINLNNTITQNELLDILKTYNNNINIDGIIVQLPLPIHLNTNIILENVCYTKDVDGFNPYSTGCLITNNINFISATPYSVLHLIDSYNINTKGKHIVIIGKSTIVGSPLALLLSNENTYAGTITLCDKYTENLHNFVSSADILIVATGVHHLINSSYVIKKDSVIIDVGIHKIKDSTKKNGYTIQGDVDFNYFENKCKYITPVPGGVGPLTVYSLLDNTYKAKIKKLTNHAK